MKFGLICVAIFDIAVLFYSLNVYNKFVSNPDNYYKNYLTKYEQLEIQEK
ncbi:hypothetical protein KJ590_02860 [Patescibacteria group bacterium]|nr:hypothetical protein [Patescibacteria group bacterium]